MNEPKRRSKALMTAKQRREILGVNDHPHPLISEIIRHLAGEGGLERPMIAKCVNLSYTDLLTYYVDDLEMGKAEAIVGVAATAYKGAKKDGNLALKWLERRGGEEWRPAAQKLQLTDDREKPPIIDSSKMSAEDRQALREILMRQINGPSEDEDQTPP